MPRSGKSESAPMPGQTETSSSNAELAAQLEAIQPAPAESAPTPASVRRDIEARNIAKAAAEDPTALREGEQASRVQDYGAAHDAAKRSKNARDGWVTRHEHEAEARAAVAAAMPPESAPAGTELSEADLMDLIVKARKRARQSAPEPASNGTGPSDADLSDGIFAARQAREARAAVTAATPEPTPLIFEATRRATETPTPDVKTRDQEPAGYTASKQEAATMAYAEKVYTDPSTMLAAHDRAGQSAAEAAVARLAEQGTPITVDLSPNPEIARLQTQAQIERDSFSSEYRSELGKLVREATVGEPGRVFRTQLTGADQLAYSEDIRTALGANKEPFIMSKDRKTHTQFYRTADDDTYIFERYDKKTNLLVEQTVINGKERELFEKGRDGHFKPGKEIKQLKKEGELSVEYARQKLDQGAEKMTYKQASGELGFAAAVMARRGVDSSEITRLKSKNPVKPNTRGFWSGLWSRL